MPTLPPNSTLLAIDPAIREFGFAVLEAPSNLLDWGLKSIPRESKSLLPKVDALLARYRPTLLVLEDIAAPGARRRKRARQEIQAIERLALERRVTVERVSRLTVLDTFAPGKSKYEVALRLAEIFPVLRPRLPRKRKAWMVEDARTNIFDALGLAVTARDRGR
jgi:hypothetical protein